MEEVHKTSKVDLKIKKFDWQVTAAQAGAIVLQGALFAVGSALAHRGIVALTTPRIRGLESENVTILKSVKHG